MSLTTEKLGAFHIYFINPLTFAVSFPLVDPNFYSKNMLMLGKTYMAMKDKEKAVLWLRKARDYPPHTEEDKEVTCNTRDTVSLDIGVFIICSLYSLSYFFLLSLQVHKESLELLKKLNG